MTGRAVGSCRPVTDTEPPAHRALAAIAERSTVDGATAATLATISEDLEEATRHIDDLADFVRIATNEALRDRGPDGRTVGDRTNRATEHWARQSRNTVRQLQERPAKTRPRRTCAVRRRIRPRPTRACRGVPGQRCPSMPRLVTG